MLPQSFSFVTRTHKHEEFGKLKTFKNKIFADNRKWKTNAKTFL